MSREGSSEKAVRVLLVIASLGVTAALVSGWGWYRFARAPVEVTDLTSTERQALVEELVAVSPGFHRWAWFEPRIGYTLKPGARVKAWRYSFTTNELGYRSGPAAKAPDTFRVLFVGDSWTFGMGVSEAESYPKVFERLAERYAGLDRRVEAWNLSLPGYNTLNEMAALWFFFDRLEPDAVVVSPTRNDNHSASGVLPNGSLAGGLVRADLFGDPHAITYRAPAVASQRYDRRWSACFAALRDTELRLARNGIPMLLFFLDMWSPAMIHAHVGRSGIESPYFVVPKELTRGEWLNPPPLLHATEAANEIFGRIVYRGVAARLGWPALEIDPDGPAAIPAFEGPPTGTDWSALYRQDARELTWKMISETFRPGPEARRQVVGPGDHATGRFGRSTTILVRRGKGVASLDVVVDRVREDSGLYPLGLTVSIAVAEGPTRVRTEIPADGPAGHRITIPLPESIPVGGAVELDFAADLAWAAENLLRGESFRVLSIDPAG